MFITHTQRGASLIEVMVVVTLLGFDRWLGWHLQTKWSLNDST
jgi:prepilin-type N-terminal cleavage/methylation domain-containing protein